MALILVTMFCVLMFSSGPASAQDPAPAAGLTAPQEIISDGITLHRITARQSDDPGTRLKDFTGPLAIAALKLDPRKVALTTALARGTAQGRETVSSSVGQTGAIAGVNAGFFALDSGDPTGLLRVDGQLVSEARLMRGAVAIVRSQDRRLRLLFDRVRVSASLELSARGAARTVAIDGIDTTRRLGKLMLYTPRYGADTGTAPSGTEWILEGRRNDELRVVERRDRAGRSAIPRDGMVLSFGGASPPAPLDRLARGQTVRLKERWQTESGRDEDAWAHAEDAVGGVGLLVHRGRAVTDWAVEATTTAFIETRHPRTVIGVDRDDAVWLIVVDGRRPDRSVGMTFAELQRLALKLGLVEALNLDGGGSTTLVVGDRVINQPSDPIGPRAVSDVLLVLRKK